MLTRYFLAYSVAEIIKTDLIGKKLFANFRVLFKGNKVNEFLELFLQLASTTVDDLNAEVEELNVNDIFDYKTDLKSSKWCVTMCGKLKAAYNKDVKRKKAIPVGKLLDPLMS